MSQPIATSVLLAHLMTTTALSTVASHLIPTIISKPSGMGKSELLTKVPFGG